MEGQESQSTEAALSPIGAEWILWGALFLRLALRGGELLWLTNLPYLRWSKQPEEPGQRFRRSRSG